MFAVYAEHPEQFLQTHSRCTINAVGWLRDLSPRGLGVLTNGPGARIRPSGSFGHWEFLRGPKLSPALPTWPTSPLPLTVQDLGQMWGRVCTDQGTPQPESQKERRGCIAGSGWLTHDAVQTSVRAHRLSSALCFICFPIILIS